MGVEGAAAAVITGDCFELPGRLDGGDGAWAVAVGDSSFFSGAADAVGAGTAAAGGAGTAAAGGAVTAAAGGADSGGALGAAEATGAGEGVTAVIIAFAARDRVDKDVANSDLFALPGVAGCSVLGAFRGDGVSGRC